jgi:hypothetical protein
LKPREPRAYLLPLERNTNGLALLSHGHTCRSLLRANGTGLGLVFDECNTLATRDQSDFLESFETTKDRRETLLTGVVGKIPEEQDLVGRQILVGDDSSCSTGCGLETGALGSLCWACVVGGSDGGALELFLGFEGVMGLLTLCKKNWQ